MCKIILDKLRPLVAIYSSRRLLKFIMTRCTISFKIAFILFVIDTFNYVAVLGLLMYTLHLR